MSAAHDDCEIVSSRLLAAPREAVFAAFADPEVLARWWGPIGFTNTLHEFEFRPGGPWKFTMHGPDGTDYYNESRFDEIAAPERLVLTHLRPMHRFLMTMTFDAESGGTRITWRMRFDSAEEVARIREFVVPANEQNFDRLAAALVGG
ncbi:MAG: SRPBCC family protein [Gemmataceae bacterium]|nr:SRPBCC family protein [Gemmataceae bacterium]